MFLDLLDLLLSQNNHHIEKTPTMKASKPMFILLFYDDVLIIFEEFFTTNHPIRMSERLMNIMVCIITFFNPFFLRKNMPLSTGGDRRETNNDKTNDGKTNEAHHPSNFLQGHISR